ncbi:MAG: hypothetical protein QM762_26385 [Chryseolinea sp.]
MKQDNVQFLKDRLFFLGFGDNLHANLEKKIKEGPDKFTLTMQGEFSQGDKKKVVDYTLDFSKSKKEDMYFVNNYTAKLKGENPEQDKSQKFFLNNGLGVTAKEAFNLLEGRAVYKTKLINKEGNEYNAWLQLNFKEKDKHENHKVKLYSDAWKYDVDKAVSRMPVKDLESAEQKEKIIKSLEKGNLTPVTLKQAGSEEKAFLESNPKDRNVILYDANMRKQFQGIREYNSERKGIKEGKEESSSQQQKPQRKEDDEPPTRKSKGRKMSV